ncbi:hypothetical protein LSTR_LSTR003721 [Laodelphax striatellus]|uniref:Annexin n=1 Tax=Laodelphax striatellus TaxID=195883 RepID=A0A482WZN7_LAOST|nr:hypothetical protein LSTR_LSTR003721 [Laodelphax striatellus]
MFTMTILLIFTSNLKYAAYILFALSVEPIVVRTATVVQPAGGVPSILSKPIDVKQEAINVNLLVSNNNLDGIAALLASKTNEQRQKIKIEYQQDYSHSLDQDLSGKTKKTYERLMDALLQPLPEFMARMINWSLEQSKNWLYMSIICTSSGELLKQIADAYYSAFNTQLIDELCNKMNDVNGLNVVATIINYIPGSNNTELFPGPRPDTTEVAEDLAKTQISCIPERYGYCSVQENPQLFDLLSKSSFAQIRAVVSAYQAKTMVSVETQMRTYCNGDLNEAYARIVRYAMNPVGYWTTEIYEAMAQKHTDDRALTLAILYRSEIDLATIRDTFNVNYRNVLSDFIKGHC